MKFRHGFFDLFYSTEWRSRFRRIYYKLLFSFLIRAITNRKISCDHLKGLSAQDEKPVPVESPGKIYIQI